MDTQITDDHRTDALDYEAFEEMLHSAAFARLYQRIQLALNTTQNQCEREDDVVRLRRAQGCAAGLRMVLSLPQQILAEMRPRK